MQVSVLGAGKHMKEGKADECSNNCHCACWREDFMHGDSAPCICYPLHREQQDSTNEGDIQFMHKDLSILAEQIVKEMCILTVMSSMTQLRVDIDSTIYGGHSLGICYFETNCLVFSTGLSRYVNSRNGSGCAGVLMCTTL